MSALKLTVMSYIEDMVSRQVREQEREAKVILMVTKPYATLVELVVFSPNFRTLEFKMSNCSRNPNQHIVTLYCDADPL